MHLITFQRYWQFPRQCSLAIPFECLPGTGTESSRSALCAIDSLIGDRPRRDIRSGSNTWSGRRGKTHQRLHRSSYDAAPNFHQGRLHASEFRYSCPDQPGHRKANHPTATAVLTFSFRPTNTTDFRIGDGTKRPGRHAHRVRRHAIVRFGSTALAGRENTSQDRTGANVCVSDRHVPERRPRRVAGGSGTGSRLHRHSMARDGFPFPEPDFFRIHLAQAPASEYAPVSTSPGASHLGRLVLAIRGSNLGVRLASSFANRAAT